MWASGWRWARWGWVFLVLCLCGTRYTHADEASGKTARTVEEAFKGIKRADGVCRGDEGGATEQAVGRTAESLPDLGCGVSFGDVLVLLLRSDSSIIDGRTAGEFAQFHLNGALNMAPAELKTKLFLNRQTLILVGNGKGERELYRACGELKRQGFRQVRVLHGGMPVWQDESRVLGQHVPWSELSRLSIEQFWAEASFESNTMVLAPAAAELRKEFPKALVMKDDSPLGLKGVLDKYPRKERRAGSILLLSGRKDFDSLAEQYRKVAGTFPLLVHVGSTSSVRQFLSTQELVWNAQSRGPKKLPCSG